MPSDDHDRRFYRYDLHGGFGSIDNYLFRHQEFFVSRSFQKNGVNGAVKTMKQNLQTLTNEIYELFTEITN